MAIAYKRVILKISGEALAGPQGFGIDFEILNGIGDQIIELAGLGCEVCIVVGAGNIWRGRSGVGMDRSTADYMGMLATTINSLALQDAIEQKGADVRVQTAIEMRQIAEPYIRRRATRHREKGRGVIFACGTGNPFFSTDTTAALRAAEMGADVILLAKNVDGVYDSDPKVNPAAVKYDEISIDEVVAKKLAAMDLTASIMCMEQKMPMLVFALDEKDSIINAVHGKFVGTKVTV